MQTRMRTRGATATAQQREPPRVSASERAPWDLVSVRAGVKNASLVYYILCDEYIMTMARLCFTRIKIYTRRSVPKKTTARLAKEARAVDALLPVRENPGAGGLKAPMPPEDANDLSCVPWRSSRESREGRDWSGWDWPSARAPTTNNRSTKTERKDTVCARSILYMYLYVRICTYLPNKKQNLQPGRIQHSVIHCQSFLQHDVRAKRRRGCVRLHLKCLGESKRRQATSRPCKQLRAESLYGFLDGRVHGPRHSTGVMHGMTHDV